MSDTNKLDYVICGTCRDIRYVITSAIKDLREDSVNQRTGDLEETSILRVPQQSQGVYLYEDITLQYWRSYKELCQNCIDWIKEKINLNESYAMIAYALLMYKDNPKIQYDEKEYFALIKKAAELNNPLGCYLYADLCENKEEAIKYCLLGVDRCFLCAARLSNIYYDKQDFKNSLKYFDMVIKNETTYLEDPPYAEWCFGLPHLFKEQEFVVSIIDKYFKYDNLIEENKKLQEELDIERTFQPNGSGYLNCKNNFNKTAKIRRNSI